jgi:hypothetical protein
MIAEELVNRLFGELDEASRKELASSMARQWRTDDGHAVVVTATYTYWFRFVERDDGYVDVNRRQYENNLGHTLLSHFLVNEEEIRGLLRKLNQYQFVDFRAVDGRTLFIFCDPLTHTVLLEEMTGRDE